MFTFENKTVFITGAASGIGLGMAKAFAEQGMNLALADRSEEQLQSAVAGFVAQGIRAIALPLDITDAPALKAAAKTVDEAFGGIHLICANAGVTGLMGSLENARDEDWDWTIDVNLKGTVNTVQTFLPYLLKQKNNAHIVLTASISGLRVFTPSRGQGMYNTTKYAILGLGEALSVDLEPHGIGVSILCPGVVNTPFSESGKNRPEKYGGSMDLPDGHDLAKLAATGTKPLIFGRWVVKAITNNLLHVITHPNDRALVEARHNKIMAAFDYSAELTQAND